MTRRIDLRDDHEKYESTRDKVIVRMQCKLWPGCECRRPQTRGECLDKWNWSRRRLNSGSF